MLGISTELNFIFRKVSLEVSPLSQAVLETTYFKKKLRIIGRMQVLILHSTSVLSESYS